MGEEEEKKAGREGAGKKKRWKESGERDFSREGSTVWSQEERMRDEGKQGMDRWLEGEREEGMLASFLARQFPAHTESTQLDTDPRGAFAHMLTQKHTLLNWC